MFRHIAVPVAFDAEIPPDAALEAAAKLAGPGSRVTVLHVMDEAPPFAISYVEDSYLETLRDGLRDELAGMAARFEHGTALLLDGHPARTLVAWAIENEVDAIVMPSQARKGAAAFLLGSTAGHVVRNAPCSVLVLRGAAAGRA